MDIGHLALLTAFTAGFVSFLSPCVLASLPTYTAFLATSGTNSAVRSSNLRLLWVNTCIFLSGFVIVFLVVGACASFLGQLLQDYQHAIRKIGALFMIGMGINALLSLIPLRNKQLYFPPNTNPIGIFLLGIASTAAWSPCNAPLLAPVLVYASTSSSFMKGIAVFSIYALGFCIPFALLSLILQQYLTRIRSFSNRLHILSPIAGLLLIILGILIFFDILG